MRVQPYGAFVELKGYRKHGLIHISQLADRHVEAVEDVLGRNAEGTQHWVKVIGLDNDKISLTMKDVGQTTGNDLDPQQENNAGRSGRGDRFRGGGGQMKEAPELYQILQGTVVKIAAFGAFVSFEGYRKNGLVHISQMMDYKVDSVEDVVEMGSTVWVKVISAEDKLSLSMKYCDQGSGKDLDPQNERAITEVRKAGTEWRPKTKITLEAIVNADCQRCGAHGHTTQDCFAPEGVRYDNLSDSDEKDPLPVEQKERTVKKKKSVTSIEQALAILADAKKKKSKKKKKKQKKALKKMKKKLQKAKKRKLKSQQESDSSGSDSSDSD
jgi:predicted RNA-binding protein with RPS1 domain